MMGDPESFDEALGALLARRRNLAGTTQADVARTAQRYCGLSWTAATVAQLESGRRHWKVEEVFLLPVILQRTEGGVVKLPQLLGGLGPIRTGKQSTVSGITLALLAMGNTSDAINHMHDTPFAREAAAAVPKVTKALKHAITRQTRVEQRWPRMSYPDLVAAEAAAQGEAERKAAYRLDVDVLEVACAAQHLWSRSLTDERNARVDEHLGNTTVTRRGVQALRGHVTRDLLAELADELEVDL